MSRYNKRLAMLLMIVLFFVLLSPCLHNLTQEGLTNGGDSVKSLRQLKSTITRKMKQEISNINTEQEASAQLADLTKGFRYEDTLDRAIKVAGGTGSAVGGWFGGNDSSNNNDGNNNDNDDEDSGGWF